MPVGDHCQQPVSTARPGETIRAAARRMERDGVGSLVVVDGEQVVGVVTDRDLIVKGLREGLDPETEPIARLLERQPVTVHADSSLPVAVGLMRRRALRRLPVVDRRERLVGIVTVDDLLRLVARALSGLAEAVAAQAPPAGEARRATEELAGSKPEPERT